ncbi:MAG: extensin family protein [Paracoccaceae bacterium]
MTSAVASALAVMASPRPLPKPRDVVASAAPAQTVIGAPRPVVPQVSAANKPPVDPIAAFFQAGSAQAGSCRGRCGPSGGAERVGRAAVAASGGAAERVRDAGRRDHHAAGDEPQGLGLRRAEIKGEAIRAIDGAGACGVEQPVKITSVSGVPVSGGPTIDCTTAIALNDWVRHRVMQAVGRTPAAGSPR